MENMKNTNIATASEPNPDFFLPLFLMEEEEPEGRFTIITSSLCEPNPHGIGAWAFVVFSPDGDMLDMDLDDIGSGEHVTNIVADYAAVIQALIWTASCEPEEPIEILTASKIVANQISGEFACNQPHLRQYRDDAVELLRQTNAVVGWVRKSETGVADVLARLAYLQAKRRQEEGEDD